MFQNVLGYMFLSYLYFTDTHTHKKVQRGQTECNHTFRYSAFCSIFVVYCIIYISTFMFFSIHSEKPKFALINYSCIYKNIYFHFSVFENNKNEMKFVHFLNYWFIRSIKLIINACHKKIMICLETTWYCLFIMLN